MRKLVTVLIVLAVAGGGGYYYYRSTQSQEKPTVNQVTITQGTIVEEVQATGTLEALRTVTVGPQVSGTIVSLEGVDFNHIVHKGQVVARLDPSLLQVQVDIQKANIERQQTDIDSQKVQLENDERTLARTKELAAKGLVNQTQLEDADLQVKTRKAQIESAEKQLVQAQANLAQAELNVSYTEVKSPIDGVVVDRKVDIGQTIQSSMNITPFFTIATDLTHLKLTAAVDESEVGKLKPDMEVLFTVDAFPNETFRGTVNAVRLNAQTLNNVVTYPVWIDAPNPELKLKPSMTANVRIVVSRAENVVRVPLQATRFRPTADMYTALGLTPPANEGRGAGGGRRGQNGAGAGAAGDAAAPASGVRNQNATPGAGQNAANAGGQGASMRRGNGNGNAAPTGQMAASAANGQNGNGNGFRNGGGFGRGGFANLSPEEREQLRAQFAQNGGFRRGGGRGTGAGGNGANGGQTPLTGAAALAASRQSNDSDQTIDELFTTTAAPRTPTQVYTWDEANKKLTPIRVVTGIADTQYAALLSGDLKVGMQVVTGISLPQTSAQRNQNNIFGQQPGRGFGGLQPGGPGGFGGGGFGGGGGGRGGR
jgi:HlyD family secretion protein